MLVGFNHNFRYRGELFHIQTEDSGIANPHIITLIYRGGTIIASKKISYADIIKIDGLERVVEELMQEQHKDMLRRLKGGEFDARAFAGAEPDGSTLAGTTGPADSAPPAAPGRQSAPAAAGLDDILLDYLVSDDSERKPT